MSTEKSPAPLAGGHWADIEAEPQHDIEAAYGVQATSAVKSDACAAFAALVLR
jgi:hypothetical protein